MKKVFLMAVFIATLIVSCNKSENQDPALGTNKISETYTYPENGILKFSGISWRVFENTETMGLVDNYTMTIINNAFTDSRGRLHLLITKGDDNWFGAELKSENSLGQGDLVAYLDSNSFPIHKDCMFSFGSEMHFDRKFNGLTESGIRIYGQAIEPPDGFIEYYAYNTDRKFASVEYPKVKLSDLMGNTLHIVSVQSNLLSFATRRGTLLDHSHYLYEYSVSKDIKRDMRQEDKIYFTKPSQDLHAFLRFSLSGIENSPDKDTIEIIIPKIDFLSPQLANKE